MGKSRMTRQADPFDWSGGHPALDLVNTLDERPSDTPIENLATYDALLRFTELAGLIEPAIGARLRSASGRACARVAGRARAMREHLYAILAANHEGQCVPQDALHAIAVEVHRAHAARALTASGTAGVISHCWVPTDTPDIPLHACALAVEALLVSGDRRRVRKCGAADCAVYFMDTSKAHRRQWCSMKNCGNREKQRRWRADSG